MNELEQEIKNLNPRIKDVFIEENGLLIVKIWFNYFENNKIHYNGVEEFYSSDKVDIYKQIINFFNEERTWRILL